MLKCIQRRQAPLDGSPFLTTGNLNSILRYATNYDDDKAQWPDWVSDTSVSCYVRMRLYKAQETKLHPDGMIYGPVVRVGSMASPEVELHGSHHSVGLFQDRSLFEYGQSDCPAEEPWLYNVQPNDEYGGRGKNADCYRCDQCGETLYRDEDSQRQSRSATLYNGSLVCRDCDVRGLVLDGPAQNQLTKCRSLANYIAETYGNDGVVPRLESRIEFLSQRKSWGDSPCQVRAWKEDGFSFYWSELFFNAEGVKKRGLCGGLIQHGPTPVIQPDMTYKFMTWDYKNHVQCEATKEEVANIEWSIHT